MLSSWKAILVLAVPAIVENFLQSMVGFVDTLFLSQLGLHEVAAVGIANTMLQIYFAVFLAMAACSTILVSRSCGEGNREQVMRICSNAILLTGLIGCLFGVVSFCFAEQILQLMGAGPEVMDSGTTYFRIVATPSLFIAMMYTLGALFRGTGDTRTPMKVGLLMNVVHILLDYVLMFGLFFHGFGIVGAAVATVCARVIGVLLLLWYLHKRSLVAWKAKVWKVNRDILRSLIRLGFPAALERLFMRFGQVIYFGMIIRMGVEIYSAHTLAGNFTLFSTIIGGGIATATSALIGQQLGARDMQSVKLYSKASVSLQMLIMTFILFLLFASAPLTARLFTDNHAVILLIVTVLGIDTLTQPATAVVTSLTSVLQAGGDTKYPMYVTAAGIWLIRTAGVYLLGVYFGLGLMGVWIAIGLDNYVRAILLWRRYRTFQWIRSV
ncbi:MATE family efflux transporter [Paenibacillus rigui]|uniref:Probable multidrug resistance protein NorM n=1 Tax=Paenibacillus rigui TaxID=554312 RepID=A0A229UY95_9BACL|nr:MATE family efflux transporter [Paenibacillus rigui]